MKLDLKITVNLWLPIKLVIDDVFQIYIEVDNLSSGPDNFDEQINNVFSDYDDIFMYKNEIINAMIKQGIGRDYITMFNNNPDALLYWRHLIQNYKTN